MQLYIWYVGIELNRLITLSEVQYKAET
jgi:hypothetical protein